jgi:hypothetical protein
MSARLATLLLAAGLLALAPGCPARGIKQPGPTPEVEQVLADLQATRDRTRSFRAESVMDYWVGREKVKGTVLVMGRQSARLRFKALNPDAGSTAVELACDGPSFEYIDFHNNCQLTGPCTGDSIAQLLGVSLEPDDFLFLAVGTSPVIGPDPRGQVTWDGKQGAWIVELTSADNQWQQRLVLDGRNGRSGDVLESTVRNARGEIEWKLTNRDFAAVKATDGQPFRVPGKTRFEQPQEKADLIVDWKKRELNLELESHLFQMSVPEIPRCGSSE